MTVENAVAQRDSSHGSGRIGVQQNGPDRSVRALQPGPNPTADETNGRGALMVPERSRYTRTESGNIRRTYKPHPALARRVRRAVYERDNYTCQICGYRPAQKEIDGWLRGANGSPHLLSLDHIIPYRDGGPFTVENIRALCLSCNCRRGART